MRFRSCLGLWVVLAAIAIPAHAGQALRAQLTLTHTATDTWRADYVLDEPVIAVDFGPAANVLEFRKKAWRILTPGVSLSDHEGNDVAASTGQPFTRLSIEIGTYKPFAQGNYAAINRFSDGGSTFYLGFLNGSAHQKPGDEERDLLPTLTLAGLNAETVIGAEQSKPYLDGYVYFGPGKPVASGLALVVLDPLAPPWMARLIDETTAKTSQFYAQVFARKLAKPLPVLIAVAGFEQPGLSMKGGAIGGKVVYRIEGNKLKDDTPAARAVIEELVAHEMAHVWQSSVSRGGIGETEPWIHEGGAEIIAWSALRATGIWSEAQADEYGAKLLDECAKLDDAVTAYRGWYACGFKRFHGYAVAPLPLWRALIETSETTGATYSSAMIEGVLAAAPAKAAGP